MSTLSPANPDTYPATVTVSRVKTHLVSLATVVLVLGNTLHCILYYNYKLLQLCIFPPFMSMVARHLSFRRVPLSSCLIVPYLYVICFLWDHCSVIIYFCWYPVALLLHSDFCSYIRFSFPFPGDRTPLVGDWAHVFHWRLRPPLYEHHIYYGTKVLLIIFSGSSVFGDGVIWRTSAKWHFSGVSRS